MLIAILLSLVAGIVLAYAGFIPPSVAALIGEAPFYCLCFMLLLVGYGVGRDKEMLRTIFSKNAAALLIPLGTVAGTLIGGAVAALILPLGLRETLAVSGGFGWYTYSAVYLAEVHSPDLGAIAFLANVGREIFAILLIPVAVRFTGPYSAVSLCGATSMDVTLPLLTHYAGAKISVIAIIHGVVLSLLTPFLIPVLIGF